MKIYVIVDPSHEGNLVEDVFDSLDKADAFVMDFYNKHKYHLTIYDQDVH